MLSKGWVKLQIEPVDVTVDNEDSLLFSTVQSVVPGAHGLYYRENGQRKALGFDTNTGRVFAPPSGWQAQDIFVHLAHGSKHGMHYADYSKATAQFEKNVSAVQKLFAGLGYGGMTGMKPMTRAGEKKTRSRSKVKSGFEAQPENVHISEESDVVTQSSPDIETKTVHELKHQIKELKKINEKLKRKSIDEVTSTQINQESELEKLKLRNSELETKLASLSNVIQSQDVSASESSPRRDNESEKEDMKLLQNRLIEKEEEMNNLHSVIEELREKNSNNEKSHNETRSSLDQHIDLLKTARDKIAYLENQLNVLSSNDVVIPVPKCRSRNTSESQDDSSSKHRSLEVKLQMATNQLRMCESDKQKLQEANWFANERVSKLEKEVGYLKGMNDEMRSRLNDSTSAKLLAERDQRISELADQRAKLEWRLGELNQWWNDSKWKIGELESNLAHQRYLLETAGNKIQNLNDHAPQAPSSSIPNYAIRQDTNGLWQLANGYFPAISQQQILPNINSYPVSLPHVYGYQNASSVDTKRVTLEIENAEQTEVFVLCSFMNWQCAVRCDAQNAGKSGVIMNLPRGKHEFRFLKNGSWTTSSLYSSVPNGFGGFNNMLIVE